jgi:hypothetical protein
MSSLTSAKNLYKAQKSGISDEHIIQSVSENDPELAPRIAEAKKQGINDSDILKALQKGPPKSFKETVSSNIREIEPSLIRGVVSGAGGAYGDLLNAVTSEKGRELISKYLPLVPGLNLPTSSKILGLLDESGLLEQPETPTGRVVERGSQLASSIVPFGGGLGSVARAGAGGILGQSSRELGAPEALATTAEIGTAINAPKILRNVIKNIPKKAPPPKTESGISLLKGVEKPPETIKTVSKKARELSEASIGEEVVDSLNKITGENIPFSKFSKGIENISDYFKKGFSKVRESAQQIFGEYEASPKELSSLATDSKELLKTPNLSPESKKYVVKMAEFIRNLKGKKLNAEGWLNQYREINKSYKSVNNLSLDFGEKAALKKALDSQRKFTSEVIRDRFSSHPDFINRFESFNNAYSQQQKLLSFNDLVSKAYKNGKFNINKFNSLSKTEKGKSIIRNSLGEEGSKQFYALEKDVKDVESLYGKVYPEGGKFLKAAYRSPWAVPLNWLGMGLISKAGKAIKLVSGLGKGSIKALNNTLLKPQGRRAWGKYLDAVKKGDVIKAKESGLILKSIGQGEDSKE